MKKDFSEAEYANYYNTILNNLCDMEICEDFGPVLQHIREDIFDSGWYGILTFSYDLLFLSHFVPSALLDKSLHDEYDRPPAPFIPCNKENPHNTGRR